MVEELILKLFIDKREVLTKYYKYVKLNYIKNNYTDIYKLFIIVSNSSLVILFLSVYLL